jgi:hypothetical protein
MTKLEYSDLYKFLVSLGIVLVTLSLFIPWLFLHESFDASLKDSEIAELTATAQALIRYRQYTALWFVQNIWWISILLAIGGLVSLILGLVLWVRRQRLADQREEFETRKVGLEVEKLRREIEPLTPTEIVMKGLEEVKEEIKEEIPEPVFISSIASRVQEYFRVEKIFLNKLIACYGGERVLAQQRMKEETYDAILISDSSNLADVVFEVKYLTSLLGSGRLHKTVDQVIRLIQNYTVLAARHAVAIILFVLQEGYEDSVLVDRYVWEIKDQSAQYDVRIHPVFLTEEELIGMKCNELQAKINKLAKKE